MKQSNLLKIRKPFYKGLSNSLFSQWIQLFANVHFQQINAPTVTNAVPIQNAKEGITPKISIDIRDDKIGIKYVAKINTWMFPNCKL